MKLLREKLEIYGLSLPAAPAPIGNYKAVVAFGNLAIVSGQLPFSGAKLQFQGGVGNDLSADQGKDAAQLCALNILSQLETALRTSTIKQLIRLEGYINCVEGFTDHAVIINAASDLFEKLLPGRSRHARVVAGCNSLPMNAAVELSAMFEFESLTVLRTER